MRSRVADQALIATPWNRVIAALVMLAMAVAACGGGTPSLSPSAQPSVPTPSPAATATPAPTPEPTIAPPTTAPTPAGPFASTVYPYTLQLPAGVLTRNWTPALFAWDGQGLFGTASRANDLTGTVDGTLMVFGLPWNDDLASFLDLVADGARRFHGCSATGERRTFEVNGVAGLAQQEMCENTTQAMGMVLLKDGYGIVVRVLVNANKVDVIFDNVVGWLDGLTWTNA